MTCYMCVFSVGLKTKPTKYKIREALLVVTIQIPTQEMTPCSLVAHTKISEKPALSNDTKDQF
jgi:hypothetical protein